MTNQSTIDKLIEMRLTAMSDAFLNQMNDPKLKEISFEDRFALLVDIEYITEHRNLFITGATGSGKTYMVCAFVMEACKQRYKTRYARLPALLLELEMSRNDGTYKKGSGKVCQSDFAHH